MRFIEIMKVVAKHLILYLIVFLIIVCGKIRGSRITTPWYVNFIWLWDTRYVSPMTRNIILIVMVGLVFPMVSFLYERARRKGKKKKLYDILSQEKKREQ